MGFFRTKCTDFSECLMNFIFTFFSFARRYCNLASRLCIRYIKWFDGVGSPQKVSSHAELEKN